MRRFFDNKLGLGAAILAVLALGLTAAVTLGNFSAGIVNSTSTFGAGTVQIKEHNGAITCYSTGTGSGGSVTATNKNTTCTINVWGGATAQKPGGTAVQETIVITNVGNIAASGGTLSLGTCTIGTTSTNGGYKGTDTAAGFCGKVDVTVALSTTAGKCLYPKNTAAACPATPTSAGTLYLLSHTQHTLTLPALAASASFTVTIKTKLDASATNIDQGIKATLPVTWSIHQ